MNTGIVANMRSIINELLKDVKTADMADRINLELHNYVLSSDTKMDDTWCIDDNGAAGKMLLSAFDGSDIACPSTPYILVTREGGGDIPIVGTPATIGYYVNDIPVVFIEVDRWSFPLHTDLHELCSALHKCNIAFNKVDTIV